MPPQPHGGCSDVLGSISGLNPTQATAPLGEDRHTNGKDRSPGGQADSPERTTVGGQRKGGVSLIAQRRP